MDILIIIFLVFIGILLLLIEFAIIPGITIAGIGGFLMLGAAVYLAFTSLGTVGGFITLALVLFLSPIIVYRIFKSKMGNKMMLNSQIKGFSNQIEENEIQLGEEGVTISRLAPIGKVRIGSKTFEAKSTGSFIDQHTPITVIEILKTQIIVEPINSN